MPRDAAEGCRLQGRKESFLINTTRRLSEPKAQDNSHELRTPKHEASTVSLWTEVWPRVGHQLSAAQLTTTRTCTPFTRLTPTAARGPPDSGQIHRYGIPGHRKRGVHAHQSVISQFLTGQSPQRRRVRLTLRVASRVDARRPAPGQGGAAGTRRGLGGTGRTASETFMI